MPNYRSLRIPSAPLLLNFSLGRPRQASVIDRLFPVLPVDEVSGTYNTFLGMEGFTDDVVDVRAQGSPTGTVGWSKSEATYNLIERGLNAFVSEEERGTMGPQAADQAGLMVVEDKLALGREGRAKTILTTSGNFGTVVVAAVAWSNAAADIVGEIRTARRGVRLKSGFEPTNIMIPDDEIANIMKNTFLLGEDAFDVEQLMAGELPARLGGMEVVTPRTLLNTANIQQTPNLAQIYDGTNAVQLLYVNPNAGVLAPTYALQFRDRTFGNNGIAIDTIEDERRHGWYIEERRKEDQRLVMKDAGAIITGV